MNEWWNGVVELLLRLRAGGLHHRRAVRGGRPSTTAVHPRASAAAAVLPVPPWPVGGAGRGGGRGRVALAPVEVRARMGVAWLPLLEFRRC